MTRPRPLSPRRLCRAAVLLLLLALFAFAAGSRPLSAAPTAVTRYVDAAAPPGGDGLSWNTAWRTIDAAAQADLPPGAEVLIRPGVYEETVGVAGSGAQVVPLHTGVSVGGDRVTFPPAADLSGIDLAAHPGEYYLYLARSLQGNHGVFPITAVDAAARSVSVAADFSPESGVAADPRYLSAAVGRPVIYRNADPAAGRVLLAANGVEGACTVLYIGGYIDPYHAAPADFNLFDGLDLAGSPACGGVHLQNSSFNVFRNGRVYDHQGTGILLDGSDTAAQYNYILDNQIWNTPYEAVYLGAGGRGPEFNQTHYNHVSGNEIFVQGGAANARLENAVDVKTGNRGNVVAGNHIHSFDLVNAGNGAIDVRDGADDTLVYGNVLQDIGRSAETGTFYLLNLYPDVAGVLVYNNLIYRETAVADGVYALNVHANDTAGVLVAHNTVYQMSGGLLLQYSTAGGDGADNGVTVANNLFAAIGDSLLEEWTWDGAAAGTFHLHHNIFPAAPDPYPPPPAFIGAPDFVDAAGGDFRLAAGSLGVDQGATLTPPLTRDLALAPRDAAPDIGAFEFQPRRTLYLPYLTR